MVWATALAAPFVLESLSTAGKVPREVFVRPFGSLLRDTDVLAHSLGVVGESQM